MTREEAVSRAAAVFARWASEGVKPFDDVGWMNPDDLAAIVDPIADALQAAAEAIWAEDLPPWRRPEVPNASCPHPSKFVVEDDDGYPTCRLCHETGGKERCGICSRIFCRCNQLGLR